MRHIAGNNALPSAGKVRKGGVRPTRPHRVPLMPTESPGKHGAPGLCVPPGDHPWKLTNNIFRNQQLLSPRKQATAMKTPSKTPASPPNSNNFLLVNQRANQQLFTPDKNATQQLFPRKPTTSRHRLESSLPPSAEETKRGPSARQPQPLPPSAEEIERGPSAEETERGPSPQQPQPLPRLRGRLRGGPRLTPITACAMVAA